MCVDLFMFESVWVWNFRQRLCFFPPVPCIPSLTRRAFRWPLRAAVGANNISSDPRAALCLHE